MKKLTVFLLAVPLFLSSCTNSGTTTMTVTETVSSESEAENQSPNSSHEDTSAEATLSNLAEGVEGKVGFRHGQDCTSVNDCSVYFTVESLETLDTCDAYTISTASQPANTDLVKAVVLVETAAESSFGQAPGEFPVWADWSIKDQDGITAPLQSSDWCMSQDGDRWGQGIHSGDTVRLVARFDVPQDAVALQLTDSLTDARWSFDLPN